MDNISVLSREQVWHRREVKEVIHSKQRGPTMNRNQGYQLPPPIYNHILLPISESSHSRPMRDQSRSKRRSIRFKIVPKLVHLALTCNITRDCFVMVYRCATARSVTTAAHLSVVRAHVTTTDTARTASVMAQTSVVRSTTLLVRCECFFLTFSLFRLYTKEYAGLNHDMPLFSVFCHLSRYLWPYPPSSGLAISAFVERREGGREGGGR